MNGLHEELLKNRLRRITAFLPRLESPGFQFGHWDLPKSESPGAMVMPSYIYSQTATELIRAAYDAEWVQSSFDWSKWKSEKEALSLRDNADYLASATPEQLSRLLTVLIRQERFCEGSLEVAYGSGLLCRILRRAVILESELSTGEEIKGVRRNQRCQEECWR